jgi:hypothetical protein
MVTAGSLLIGSEETRVKTHLPGLEWAESRLGAHQGVVALGKQRIPSADHELGSFSSGSRNSRSTLSSDPFSLPTIR